VLVALQIASAENRAPAAVATADATADAVVAASTDAKDDSGSAGDDDSDDVSREARWPRDQKAEQVLMLPPFSATRQPAQRSPPALFLRSTHIAFSSHSAAETLRLLAQRKAAAASSNAAVNQPKYK
jgi:hypothetical protein